jgi:hypothetical protein
MIKQFIGKYFWLFLVGFLAVETLSFFTLHTRAEYWVLAVLVAVTSALAVHRLDLALYIAFAELFIGSMGRLFSTDLFGFDFSLRMGLFVVVMVFWAIKMRRRDKWGDLFNFRYKWPVLLLAAAVLVGSVIGLTHNEPLHVLYDVNGWLFLVYLMPVLTEIKGSRRLHELLQVLFAAFVWLVMKTWAVFYIFTHFGDDFIRMVYRWIRDTRVGEITTMDYEFVRIFFQSHLFVLVVLCLFLAALWFVWRENKTFVFVTLTAGWSVMVAGLSRSFAVGLFCAGLVMIVAVVFYHKKDWRMIGQRALVAVMAVLTGVIMLFNLAAWPWPAGEMIGLSGMLSDRFTDTEEVALTSRWNLWPALWDKIAEDPVFGSGFGTEVSYESNDPRVREKLPNGVYTTYSFEWGYLDVWLKTGVWGLVSLLWLGMLLGRDCLRRLNQPQGWLYLGWGMALAALFAAHFFTPYLNHPLGLGLLLLIIAFLQNKKAAEPVAVKAGVKKSATEIQPKAIAVSSRK